MKERWMNLKHTLTLYCLLAEQVSSQERLLWLYCLDPNRSSSARTRSLLASKAPYAIGIGSVVVGCLLAVMAFFSSTAQSISVDAALNSAVYWFGATLVVGMLLYASPDKLKALRIKRPRLWRLLMASPFGPLIGWMMRQQSRDKMRGETRAISRNQW